MNARPNWASLLRTALTVPGTLSRAYRMFTGYSLRNRILALVQCDERQITPGPIATYKRWQELGRQVKKGEKALMLCSPRTARRTDEKTGEKVAFVAGFDYRNAWFVHSQTDPVEGATEPEPAPTPGWDRAAALAALEITEEPYTETNGAIQGYSRGRTFAVSPMCPHPVKTTFHELGHIVLGHTAEGAISHAESLPRNLKELEAEAVALLCLDALELPGADLCRGYIQHWYAGDEIPEESAERIITAADRILTAGSR